MPEYRYGLHVNNSPLPHLSSITAIRWTVIFAAAGLALITSKVRATDVAVVGLFPSKAVIVVNGAAPRTVSIGQRLTEVKQLKGSLNAFFSQGIAKLFGHDLKDEYDPTQGQDKTIENIVQQIERGEITF